MNEKAKEAMRLWTLAVPTVSAFVTSMVRNFDDRDDILQETAVAVIESFERYDPALSFVGWAIGIAKNQARAHERRKNSTRIKFDSESLEAIARAFESEGPIDRRLDRLGECYEALDERSRELCRWRYERELKPMAMLVCVLTMSLPSDFALGQGKQKENQKGAQKHIFSGPAPDHPFDVILAKPTNKSIVVSVLAYKEMTIFLTSGVVKSQPSAKSAEYSLKPDSPVEILLNDLKPETLYYYRLHTKDAKQSDFVAESECTFHTQRKPGSPFVFTVQSDSHLDQGTRVFLYERTLANALADKTDFHIDIGDTFMTDKYEKYKDSLPQYVAQRYYFGLISRSAPLFLVLGNHDGERFDRYDGTANNMPVWSNQMRKKYFPTPTPDGFYVGNQNEVKHVGKVANYYAFEWGDAMIIALDPFWTTPRIPRSKANGNWDRTLGKEQYDWLVKTLEGSKARFKFVFIHHLVGGLDESARGGIEAATLFEWGGKTKDGKDEFKARRPGWDMPIHQLFVKHKVSVVFHGHDHFYAQQELDDVKYVMVPQPGHPGFDRLRNVEDYGYIRRKFLSPAGHVRVSVTQSKATVDYVRSYLPASENATRKNGDIADSFVIVRK